MIKAILLALSIGLAFMTSPSVAAGEQEDEVLTLPAQRKDQQKDWQDELQDLFDEAAEKNLPVRLPAGIFRHSGILTLNGIEVSGEGAQTILEGWAHNRSAIVLTGTRPKLLNMRILFRGKSRSSYDEAALVLIAEAENFTAKNLVLEGGDSAGFFVRASGPGLIASNIIRGTLSDSIHITKQSHDLLVKDNITIGSGDDGIAVVSYEKDKGLSKNVTITHNAVLDNKYARGISVIGGKNVLIDDNFIRCSQGYAGIMLASESSFRTYGVSHIDVQNNVVQGCGGPKTGHGAIMISRDNRDHDHITIQDNRVIDAPANGILIEGKRNAQVIISNNTIVRAKDDAIYKRNADNDISIFDNDVINEPKRKQKGSRHAD